MIFAGWNTGGYGNLVVVKHRLGFATWYAHMSRIASRPGQVVSGGTLLGYVGSTGRSTGPHLHFEVRRFDTPVDPLPYLLAGTAAQPSTSRANTAGSECGPATGNRAEAVKAHGPKRIARAAPLAGC